MPEADDRIRFEKKRIREKTEKQAGIRLGMWVAWGGLAWVAWGGLGSPWDDFTTQNLPGIYPGSTRDLPGFGWAC